MKRITIEHIVNSTYSVPDPPIVMCQYDDDFLDVLVKYRVCKYCKCPRPIREGNLECEGCGAPMVEE